MFYKMDVFELQNSQESIRGGVSFFMKLHSSCLLFANLLKKSLAQLSSYEFCEIFEKTFPIEHRCLSLLSILSLSNLTIDYKLKVVSYCWKSESRVNVN